MLSPVHKLLQMLSLGALLALLGTGQAFAHAGHSHLPTWQSAGLVAYGASLPAQAESTVFRGGHALAISSNLLVKPSLGRPLHDAFFPEMVGRPATKAPGSAAQVFFSAAHTPMFGNSGCCCCVSGYCPPANCSSACASSLGGCSSSTALAPAQSAVRCGLCSGGWDRFNSTRLTTTTISPELPPPRV